MAKVKHVNQIFITGNLGKPGVFEKGGMKKTYAQISSGGQTHSLVAFNGVGETLQQFVEGTKVDIEGRINVRAYTTKEGEKKTITEVFVFSVAESAADEQVSVILIGNTGTQVEAKSPNGKGPFANFRVATNRNYKRGDQWEKETTWHTVVAKGPVAEAANGTPKGTALMVEGTLVTRSFKGRDNQEKTVTEVVAAAITPVVVTEPQIEDRPF